MQTIMINPPRAEYLPAVVSSPSVPPHLAGHHTLPPHLTPSTSPHLTPHPSPLTSPLDRSLLKHLGLSASSVQPNIGLEQEFFLEIGRAHV